jgi:hypothetical protein
MAQMLRECVVFDPLGSEATQKQSKSAGSCLEQI